MADQTQRITRHTINGDDGVVPAGEVIATETDGPRGALTVWVAHPVAEDDGH